MAVKTYLHCMCAKMMNVGWHLTKLSQHKKANFLGPPLQNWQ